MQFPGRCLKAMTDKGRLCNLDSLIGFGLMPLSSRMANTNTSKLICNKSNGTILREYEDLNNFSVNMAETESSFLFQLMLNQMAIKDNLLQDYEDLYVLRKLIES